MTYADLSLRDKEAVQEENGNESKDTANDLSVISIEQCHSALRRTWSPRARSRYRSPWFWGTELFGGRRWH